MASFLRVSHQNPVHTSPLFHTRYMPFQSHSSRFYHPKNIVWGVQIIKLFIMWVSPGSRLSVWMFRNMIRFYGEELLETRPTPNWKTTPCRLSATAYLIYSQLLSTLEAVSLSATWGRVMPWTLLSRRVLRLVTLIIVVRIDIYNRQQPVLFRDFYISVERLLDLLCPSDCT
jgi:hypothetical protein